VAVRPPCVWFLQYSGGSCGGTIAASTGSVPALQPVGAALVLHRRGRDDHACTGRGQRPISRTTSACRPAAPGRRAG